MAVNALAPGNVPPGVAFGLMGGAALALIADALSESTTTTMIAGAVGGAIGPAAVVHLAAGGEVAQALGPAIPMMVVVGALTGAGVGYAMGDG